MTMTRTLGLGVQSQEKVGLSSSTWRSVNPPLSAPAPPLPSSRGLRGQDFEASLSGDSTKCETAAYPAVLVGLGPAPSSPHPLRDPQEGALHGPRAPEPSLPGRMHLHRVFNSRFGVGSSFAQTWLRHSASVRTARLLEGPG